MPIALQKYGEMFRNKKPRYGQLIKAADAAAGAMIAGNCGQASGLWQVLAKRRYLLTR